MTRSATLPALQDPEDARLRRQEVVDALQTQAAGGNVVAVAALDRMERDSRYLSLITGMDDDEDPSVAIED